MHLNSALELRNFEDLQVFKFGFLVHFFVYFNGMTPLKQWVSRRKTKDGIAKFGCLKSNSLNSVIGSSNLELDAYSKLWLSLKLKVSNKMKNAESHRISMM